MDCEDIEKVLEDLEKLLKEGEVTPATETHQEEDEIFREFEDFIKSLGGEEKVASPTETVTASSKAVRDASDVEAEPSTVKEAREEVAPSTKKEVEESMEAARDPTTRQDQESQPREVVEPPGSEKGELDLTTEARTGSLDLEAQSCHGALSPPEKTDEEKMKDFMTKDEKKGGDYSPTATPTTKQQQLAGDPHALKKVEEFAHHQEAPTAEDGGYHPPEIPAKKTDEGKMKEKISEDEEEKDGGRDIESEKDKFVEPSLGLSVPPHYPTERLDKKMKGKIEDEKNEEKPEGQRSKTKEITLHHPTQTQTSGATQHEITEESSESEEEKKSEFGNMLGNMKKQKVTKRLIKEPDGDRGNGGSGIGEESDNDQILDRLERSFNEAETKLQHLKTTNISIMSYSAAANAVIVAIAVANFKLFITKEEEIRILKEYVNHLFHLVDFAMHTLLIKNIAAYIVTIMEKVEKMKEFKRRCKIVPCPLFRGSGYRDWGNHSIWIICSILLQVWVWVMFYAISRGIRNLCFNLFH